MPQFRSLQRINGLVQNDLDWLVSGGDDPKLMKLLALLMEEPWFRLQRDTDYGRRFLEADDAQ